MKVFLATWVLSGPIGPVTPQPPPVGASTVSTIEGIAVWGGLALCVLYLAYAVISYIRGKASHTPHHIVGGTNGILASVLGAIVLGGVAAIINGGFTIGQGIH